MIENTPLDGAGSRLASGLRQVLGASGRNTPRMQGQDPIHAKAPLSAPSRLNLPDFSTMEFDFSAPRGTYLDILI